MAKVKLPTLIIILLISKISDIIECNNNFRRDGNANQCLPRSYGMDSIVCVCNATYCDILQRIKPLPPSQYTVYTSNQEGLRFQKRTSFFIVNDIVDTKYIIIDPNITYQSIIGWGAGFTDTSGFNIHYLNDGTKENLLRSYFSKNGIEYNLGRVPMGSSEFSSHLYSYNDGEEDEQLNNFKLGPEDYKYKIPLIQQANALSNGTLWLLASAWATPQWMKTNGIGFLRSSMYQAWANYFLKFLDSYWEQWIDFWGITTGNQALGADTAYLIPEQMRFWINNYLGPTLRNSEYKSLKLLAFDSEVSFSSASYINKLFLSATTKNYTDGITIHSRPNTIPSSTSLGFVHHKFPEKFILNTEASMGCGTKMSLGAWKNGEHCANDIMMNLENWVVGWMESNLAVDMTGGPTYTRTDSAIVVNTAADEFYKQPMFYTIGHFSKFISRGSIRINLLNQNIELKMVAFKKPDNGIVIVILNRKSKSIPIIIHDYTRGNIDIAVEPKSVTTILYW